MKKRAKKSRITVNINLFSCNKVDCDAKFLTVLIFAVIAVLSIALIMSGSESNDIANYIRLFISSILGT